MIPTKRVSEPETKNLYRMPWTMSDNGFSWLEPTRACNMRCEYCYQDNDPNSNKSLAKTRTELETLLRLRKCDVMLIAGGEPLVHPDIVEIARMVAGEGVRPILLTNGLALTPSLVRELKGAGLKGFVFHVDVGQRRPGWFGATELELNELRQTLADMVYDAKDMVVGFNTTILPSTLSSVPDVVRWTIANPHKVAANVFIPVRSAHREQPWDYYSGTTKINVDNTPYGGCKNYSFISAQDICEQIRTALPHYSFHAYLGGTVIAEAPKWLFGTHVASTARVYGHLGPRGSEFVQNAWHLKRGRFLAMPTPAMQRRGKLLFLLGLVDSAIRKAWLRRVRHVVTHPLRAFDRLFTQSIVVMQPHDILPNGEQDECDGCPNKTVWKGRLVSECRKEDYIRFKGPITAVPKTDMAATSLNRIA